MSLLSDLFRTFYGSESVEFQSSFDLVESIARLKAATVSSVFRSLFKESAVGTVTAKRVSLQRVIPMIGNSFKPFFVGSFVERDGRVFLTGRFTMHWFAKAFFTLWFLVALLAAVVATPSLISHQQWFALAPLLMLGAGVAILSFGRWLSRKDPVWLSSVITGALCDPKDGRPAALLKPTGFFEVHRLKIVIVGVVAFFALVFAFISYLDTTIVESPGFARADSFVRSSVSVKKVFGDRVSVEYNHNAHIQTEFNEPKDSTGRFGFSVKGSNGCGAVTVYWKYNATTHQFLVTRLYCDGPTGRSEDLPPN